MTKLKDKQNKTKQNKNKTKNKQTNIAVYKRVA